MRETLANLIKRLHTMILGIAILGWLIPDHQWLKGYLVLMGFILVQWLTCNNNCILTVWENRLRSSTKESAENTEETFIGRSVNHLCGWQPSANIVNLVSYMMLVVFMCIAGARLHYDF